MSPPPYLCQACICHYIAIDTEDIKYCCKGRQQCLCITNECCVESGNKEGFGIGLDTNTVNAAIATFGVANPDVCKIKGFCCQMGLKKKPNVCWKGASHCLCIKQAKSLPFHKNYVKEPICAICFLQILPEFGTLQEAPTLHRMVRS